MTNFPGSIYSPREKANKSSVVYDANKKTTVFAEDTIKLDDEVVAIETELGLNPKGAYATVVARLNALTFDSLRRVATVVDVDFKVTGNTTIYTVPAGFQFIPTSFVVRGKVSTNPNYDGYSELQRVSDSSLISELASVYIPQANSFVQSVLSPLNAGGVVIIPAGGSVRLAISTADTGTALTFDIDLFGYLQAV